MALVRDNPSSVDLLLRQVDYWRTVYRRTWRGSVVASFVQPLFYVAAMGVLLGDYIDDGGASLEGAPSYLAYIAPGLLAAQAMQVSAAECMFPVMSAIRWVKTYHGMLATPLDVPDIVRAHLAFVAFRIAMSCAVFGLVLAPFDVYGSVAGALCAYLGAVLVGMAFATCLYAFAAGVKSEQWFVAMMRLGILPLFLFSGAFFPISNLAPPLEALARVTPLWHGVDLVRMCTLGQPESGAVLVHLTYLVAMVAVGYWWAVRRLRARMVV
ncbi:MAG TPA: ABC transporter permease [Nocardioidaceae bacterium]|nr:ABC transporter permease [Nocardioidaceae bacterium]